MRVASPAEMSPTSRLTREPMIMRENTSRPSSSVPKGWDRLGGSRMASTSMALGSCTVSQGAMAATDQQAQHHHQPQHGQTVGPEVVHELAPQAPVFAARAHLERTLGSARA